MASREDHSMLNLCFSVFIITAGSNFQIYNYGVVNNVKHLVDEWTNDSFIDRFDRSASTMEIDVVFSVVATASMVGAILGAALTKVVGEKLGRRKGLMLSSVINIAGALAAGIAKPVNIYELLVIGRLLLGVSVGLGFSIAAMFLSEIAPVKFRGAVGTLPQIITGFGDVFSLAVTLHVLLGQADLWPFAFALPAIPSALQLLFLIFYCHESPRYLYVTKSNVTAAEKAVLFYQGHTQAETTLADLKNEAESVTRISQSKCVEDDEVTMLQLIRISHYRKPLVIASVVMAAYVLSGIGPVIMYSTEMFVSIGLDLRTAIYGTVGLGFCNFAFSLISLFVIEKAGRRILYFLMMWGCLVSLIALSIFSYISVTYEAPWAAYLSILFLVSYQIWFAVGAPVCWIVTSELFETRARSIAMTVTSVLFWLLQTIFAMVYLPFKEIGGISLSFLPFIASLVFCILFLTKRLPETKGRTVEDIVSQFKANVMQKIT